MHGCTGIFEHTENQQVKNSLATVWSILLITLHNSLYNNSLYNCHHNRTHICMSCILPSPIYKIYLYMSMMSTTQFYSVWLSSLLQARTNIRHSVTRNCHKMGRNSVNLDEDYQQSHWHAIQFTQVSIGISTGFPHISPSFCGTPI